MKKLLFSLPLLLLLLSSKAQDFTALNLPLESDANPAAFASYDGRLFFANHLHNSLAGLWKYDESSFPENFTVCNGRLYFTADDGSLELWSSDGTPEGTHPLINPAASKPNPLLGTSRLMAHDDCLFFGADYTGDGHELWAFCEVGAPLPERGYDPELNRYEILPDPAAPGKFQLQMESEKPDDFILTVTDAYGKVVWKEEIRRTADFQRDMDLTWLSGGAYTLRVSNEERQFVLKIVRE